MQLNRNDEGAASAAEGRDRAGGGPAAETAVLGLALVLLLPFLPKALTIDDPLFVWTARQIHKDILDPYGYEGNWSGHVQPMHLNILNPPLASYWLALAGTVSWREWWLHLAMVPWALLAIGGTMRLARKLGAAPVPAGLLTVATSAFLVSATTVMCDVMMLALMVWSMALWIDGLERRRAGLLVLAALLAGLAALTKYFAISAVPLAAAYTVMRERRVSRSLLPLLIPVAVLLAWNLWSRHLYGGAHMFAAAEFARSRTFTRWFPLNRLYPLATFLGGCLVWPLVVGLRRARWGGRLVIACGSLLGPPGLHFWLTLKGQAGAPTAANYVLSAVFVAAAVAALYLAARFLRARRGEADAWLLGLWIGGTLLFVFCFNWTVSARNLLPVVPALAIVAAGPRAAGKKAAGEPDAGREGRGRVAAAVGVGAGLAVALAATWADFDSANSVRDEAARLMAVHGTGRGSVFPVMNPGLQYYMEPLGGKAFDLRNQALTTDDRVVLSKYTERVITERFASWPCVERVAGNDRAWLHLLDPSSGAGFYTHGFGPLPMSIGDGRSDWYAVVRPPEDLIFEPGGAG